MAMFARPTVKPQRPSFGTGAGGGGGGRGRMSSAATVMADPPVPKTPMKKGGRVKKNKGGKAC